MEKWPFVDQNHGLTTLEKSQLFDFLNFFFLRARKAFFCSRISWNTFSWPILLKKKTWKNGHFLTKTMGKIWKNLNFSTFWTCCFYRLKRRFFVLEYCKSHFPCLYCKKKKHMEKWPFFGQNHGLTPLEKSQFFDFLNFFFLWARKTFFCSRIV